MSLPQRTATFEQGRGPVARVANLVPTAKPRPDHYKVICISFYNEDLEHLDEVVRGLKSRGLTKANRSAVLREAMRQFDPSRVGRGL